MSQPLKLHLTANFPRDPHLRVATVNEKVLNYQTVQTADIDKYM